MRRPSHCMHFCVRFVSAVYYVTLNASCGYRKTSNCLTKMDKEAFSKTEGVPKVSWWKQRSDLEKVLLISLGTATVLIIGIMLYTSIKPTGKIEQCTTPGCIEVAAQIINNIDPAIDPCEDFFKFSCGKLFASTHGDVNNAPVKIGQDQLKRKLSEIIREPISDVDHQSIKNQKMLFQGCMDEATVEKETLNIFNNSLQELNGWPVVVGTSWKENLFDWTEMMTKLRRKGYSYSMILNIEVVFMGEFVVYIDSPLLPKIDDRNKELYKEFMVDTAVALGAKKHQAEEDMKMVLDFMEKLEEVSGENDRSAMEMESSIQSVDDFKTFEDDVDWLELINGIFGPKNKISKNTHAVFPKLEFLVALFDLIDATPKRIQANYMLWMVVEGVIQFLSKELQELQENYYHLSKIVLPAEDRFEFCFKAIAEKFADLPSIFTYARRYLPKDKRQQVQELFNNIKSNFEEILGDTPWMDDKSRDKTLKKANDMTEIIGTYGDYFDDAIFNQGLNPTLNLKGEPFFKMYLTATKAAQDALFSPISTSTKNPNLDCFEHIKLVHQYAEYVAESNNLIFPVGLLESFHPDRPTYEHYGTIGFVIGSVLTKGFSETGYDKYSDVNGIWTNQTREGYKERETCISNAFKKSNAQNTTNRVTATINRAKIISEISGIKASYAAYKKWADKNGAELDLVGIDYSPNQLFWISAMLYQCSRFSVGDLHQVVNNYELKTFETTAFVRNDADFAEDFNCAANSQMNPSEKCQVF